MTFVHLFSLKNVPQNWTGQMTTVGTLTSSSSTDFSPWKYMAINWTPFEYRALNECNCLHGWNTKEWGNEKEPNLLRVKKHAKALKMWEDGMWCVFLELGPYFSGFVEQLPFRKSNPTLSFLIIYSSLLRTSNAMPVKKLHLLSFTLW